MGRGAVVNQVEVQRFIHERFPAISVGKESPRDEVVSNAQSGNEVVGIAHKANPNDFTAQIRYASVK